MHTIAGIEIQSLTAWGEMIILVVEKQFSKSDPYLSMVDLS